MPGTEVEGIAARFSEGGLEGDVGLVVAANVDTGRFVAASPYLLGHQSQDAKLQGADATCATCARASGQVLHSVVRLDPAGRSYRLTVSSATYR